jgi:hypothetical protein
MEPPSAASQGGVLALFWIVPEPLLHHPFISGRPEPILPRITGDIWKDHIGLRRDDVVFLHVVPIPLGVQDSSGSGQKHVTVPVSDIRVLTICVRITPPLAGFPVSNPSSTHISYQLTLPSPGDQEGTDED